MNMYIYVYTYIYISSIFIYIYMHTNTIYLSIYSNTYMSDTLIKNSVVPKPLFGKPLPLSAVASSAFGLLSHDFVAEGAHATEAWEVFDGF